MEAIELQFHWVSAAERAVRWKLKQFSCMFFSFPCAGCTWLFGDLSWKSWFKFCLQQELLSNKGAFWQLVSFWLLSDTPPQAAFAPSSKNEMHQSFKDQKGECHSDLHWSSDSPPFLTDNCLQQSKDCQASLMPSKIISDVCYEFNLSRCHIL